MDFFLHRCGQAIKVNWAYASTQREDTSGEILLKKNLTCLSFVSNFNSYLVNCAH